jgi:flagellar hook-basal body complex protein FliE
MADLKIEGQLSFPEQRGIKPKGSSGELVGDFNKVLKGAVQDLDRQLHQADLATQEMTLGKQDIHQAMIALEQANISLRLLIQVRNKVISAYEEIMRMQI